MYYIYKRVYVTNIRLNISFRTPEEPWPGARYGGNSMNLFQYNEVFRMSRALTIELVVKQ